MTVADVSLTFDPAPPWSLPYAGPLALAGLAIGLVWLTLWTYRGAKVPRRRLLVVVSLRLLALLVAVLTVLRPAFAVKEDEQTPSTLLLALDTSKSMTVADEVDNRSRWQMMQRILNRSKQGFDHLSDTFKVTIKTHGFAEDVVDDPKAPDGSRTDFGQMLRTLAQRYGQERALRGLLILSDGADNGARYPAQAEAARFRSLNCPIYTFALGQRNTSTQQRDLALTKIIVDPSPAPVKGKVVVRAFVDAPGFEFAKSTARLYFDGKEIVGKEVVLQKITDNEVILETNAPATPGEIMVTVKIEPRPGEASTANNEMTTYLTIGKEGLSVLLVDRLRLETAYIRRALVGDPRMRLFESIRQTDDPPRGPLHQLYNLDRQAYDVIVIGDVSRRRFTGGDDLVLAQIEELVRVKGVGLLMIGGQDSFGNGGWTNSPISDALPVQMDVKGQSDEAVQLLPTPASRNDYLMRIGPDPAMSELLWKKLPSLPGYTRFGRRKDGATVVGQSARDVPLFVKQNYGKGRTAALALDMTYLWQQLGQNQRPRTNEGIDAHNRFWRQLMLYLAQQEETEGSVWIKPDVRRVPVGAKVGFAVGVRGKTGMDLPDAKFEVQSISPSGPLTDPIVTSRDKDADRGTFWKTEQPGEYKLVVKGSAKDADGAVVTGEATARFLVYQDDTELLRSAADYDFLQRLAQTAGGQSYMADELPRFLDELGAKPLSNAGSKTRFYPDWRTTKLGAFPPALLVLFVALLGTEWGLRRWWGMV